MEDRNLIQIVLALEDRSLVTFVLPEGLPIPALGTEHLLMGKLYRVAFEPIVHWAISSNDSSMSVAEQLSEVLATVYEDVRRCQTLLSTLKSVKVVPVPDQVTPGGIIIPAQGSMSLAGGSEVLRTLRAERIVFVRLTQKETKKETKENVPPATKRLRLVKGAKSKDT
jgi:hypothetical protein